MPMIVYKTLDLDVYWVQSRRLKCDNCMNPFVLIHHDTFNISTTGVPLVSNDEKMRDKVLRQARGKLRSLARENEVGHAACPHCGHYQKWMISSSYLGSITCFSIATPVLVGVAGGIWSWFSTNPNALMITLIAAGCGLLVGATLGFLWARSDCKPQSERDEKSMTDEEFTEMVQKAEAEEADHALAWHFHAEDSEPGEKTLVVSLGFLDEVGDMTGVPESISTTQALAGLVTEPD